MLEQYHDTSGIMITLLCALTLLSIYLGYSVGTMTMRKELKEAKKMNRKLEREIRRLK